MPDPLAVAVLAFTATADVSANAARIRAALAEAARSHARLLLTCECALIGYPSAGRDDLSGIDWQQVAACELELARDADKAGIALVLGSASARSGDAAHGTLAITNDAVVFAGGRQQQRHRKRCLTPIDHRHFVADASTAASMFRIDGWTLGLSICFEVRFGRFWAAQALAGADGFLHLAHMAGVDQDPGIKAAVLPGMYGTRAAEWATPVLVANTAQADRWLDSGLWDARGIRTHSIAEGLLVTHLHPREEHQPWYGLVRAEALACQIRTSESVEP